MEALSRAEHFWSARRRPAKRMDRRNIQLVPAAANPWCSSARSKPIAGLSQADLHPAQQGPAAMNVSRHIPAPMHPASCVSKPAEGNAASCQDRITPLRKWLSDAKNRPQCGSFAPNITCLRPFWRDRMASFLVPTIRCRTRIKHKTHSLFPR